MNSDYAVKFAAACAKLRDELIAKGFSEEQAATIIGGAADELLNTACFGND